MKRYFIKDYDSSEPYYDEGILTIDSFNKSIDCGVYSCYVENNLCLNKAILNLTELVYAKNSDQKYYSRNINKGTEKTN